MVWAQTEPVSFGDYFPHGDCVGWRERLTEYFNLEMPPEERALYEPDARATAYIYQVATKFSYEVGTKWGDRPVITPIVPHEMPRMFKTAKSCANLASLIFLPDRLWAVDETLKDIIERLEPGVHVFWPMTITMPKDKVYPKPYYGMIVGRYLDSFSPGKSAEGSWESNGPTTFTVYMETKEYIQGLAFSASAIGSAHLWCEKRLVSPRHFYSDTLQSEIAKAGLRLPKHYRVKEV